MAAGVAQLSFIIQVVNVNVHCQNGSLLCIKAGPRVRERERSRPCVPLCIDVARLSLVIKGATKIHI